MPRLQARVEPIIFKITRLSPHCRSYNRVKKLIAAQAAATIIVYYACGGLVVQKQ